MVIVLKVDPLNCVNGVSYISLGVDAFMWDLESILEILHRRKEKETNA